MTFSILVDSFQWHIGGDLTPACLVISVKEDLYNCESNSALVLLFISVGIVPIDPRAGFGSKWVIVCVVLLCLHISLVICSDIFKPKKKLSLLIMINVRLS